MLDETTTAEHPAEQGQDASPPTRDWVEGLEFASCDLHTAETLWRAVERIVSDIGDDARDAPLGLYPNRYVWRQARDAEVLLEELKNRLDTAKKRVDETTSVALTAMHKAREFRFATSDAEVL
jgi:hypothetical protein